MVLSLIYMLGTPCFSVELSNITPCFPVDLCNMVRQRLQVLSLK